MLYKFDFSFLLERWPDFLNGAWLTIQLTVLSISLGFVVGTLCAVIRVYGGRPLRLLVGGYVELIRNTPLLVQIFIVYFGLASIGIKFSAFTAAIAALVINVGAYTAEIVRAGIESVPSSQPEAAECLALARTERNGIALEDLSELSDDIDLELLRCERRLVQAAAQALREALACPRTQRCQLFGTVGALQYMLFETIRRCTR